MRHSYDKKCLVCSNQTRLQHILPNKVQTEYFTCDKPKDIFNMYIYGFAHTNKL